MAHDLLLPFVFVSDIVYVNTTLEKNVVVKDVNVMLNFILKIYFMKSFGSTDLGAQ